MDMPRLVEEKKEDGLMDMPPLVEEKTREYSAEKDRTRPLLGKIYALLTTIFGVVADDARDVFRGFFPALGTRPFMDAHARALRLPTITNEIDGSLRTRLLRAGHYMRYLGTRKSLVEFMDSSFKGRYSIIEMPKDAFTIDKMPKDASSDAYYATPIGTSMIMDGEGLYITVKGITKKENERTSIQTYIETNTPPDVGYSIFNI